MESFVKSILSGKNAQHAHRYFVRFGKGEYARRFLIRFTKGKTIKVKASFEMANDFITFTNSLAPLTFSGKILSRHALPGLEGKKKGGGFVYEVQDVAINKYPDAYYYLLDTTAPGISLKIKKSLPKPGKDEEKIDDAFCSLELDTTHWSKLREAFFWDLPECKSAQISHTLKITSIELPKGEKDPVKIRENALRKGTMVRVITADDKDLTKEYPFEA